MKVKLEFEMIGASLETRKDAGRILREIAEIAENGSMLDVVRDKMRHRIGYFKVDEGFHTRGD